MLRLVLAVLLAIPVLPAADAALDAAVRKLCAQVAATPGITFVRNGSDHTPAKAAEHLLAKYDHVRDELTTIDDFIARCATRSETSGKEYQVRLADGRAVPSAQYLRSLLAPPAPAVPSAPAKP